MYIRKADRKLFRDLDEYLVLPKGFYRSIDKVAKKHNLIVKKGTRKYYCTHCGSEFEEKNVRIGERLKCPKCKIKYDVRSSNLKKCEFSDCIGVLDKYKDYFIIRYFEILSTYDGIKFKADVCEYGRKIFDEYFEELHEIINNHIFSGIGCVTIRHDGYIFDNNWHYFNSYWKGLGDNLIFYPGNIKKVLKNTRYQYSQLWTLAKHKEYFDLRSLLHLYDDSTEFLIKLKLYNLVGNHIRGRNFEERFEISKEFLPFMQKNNIDSEELDILKFYKKKNIKTIRYFKNTMISEEMIKYKVDLDELLKRTNYCTDYHFEYCDYLRFAEELKLDMKDKKILYPKNIVEEHNKLLAQIEIKKNQKINKDILKRFKELKKYVFKNKKYIIYPAKSIEELIDESSQQNNCVKTYAERYANKECDIYFMRLLTDQTHSLVTVEIRNNKIIQQRIKGNEDTTIEQKKFLKRFEKEVLNA